MLSEALPAQSGGPWRPEGGRALEPRPANARARLAGPGPCCARWTQTRRTVDYFLRNERYVAERHFGSQETF